MATNNDIRAAIDNSRLTTRLSVFGGIASLLLLILTIVLGMVRGEAGGADVFSLAVIPFSMALLFSLSSLVFGVLRTSAAQEEEEKQLLENGAMSALWMSRRMSVSPPAVRLRTTGVLLRMCWRCSARP